MPKKILREKDPTQVFLLRMLFQRTYVYYDNVCILQESIYDGFFNLNK